MLETQIARIKEKLARIKGLDKNLHLFGASGHKYELNEPLTNEQIEKFEKQYKITLPSGYRLFLSKIGNGGGGPYYGIVELEKSLYSDMEYRKEDEKLDPSLPFPHTEPQYMYSEETSAGDFDEEEFYAKWNDPVHEQGVLRICNYGCGVFIDLVVNGAEYGNMWVSDIGNDAGVFPVGVIEEESERKIGFLDWYEQWLDKCFKEMELINNE